MKPICSEKPWPLAGAFRCDVGSEHCTFRHAPVRDGSGNFLGGCSFQPKVERFFKVSLGLLYRFTLACKRKLTAYCREPIVLGHNRDSQTNGCGSHSRYPLRPMFGLSNSIRRIHVPFRILFTTHVSILYAFSLTTAIKSFIMTTISGGSHFGGRYDYRWMSSFCRRKPIRVIETLVLRCPPIRGGI